jgi:putative MATE family efflux protein
LFFNFDIAQGDELSLLKEIVDGFLGKERDLTTGSINKALIILSIPMIVEMGGEAAFAIFDAYFVGQLGSYALATVGLTEAILFLVYSIAIGMSMSATALVARRTGEKDIEGARNVGFQAIIISLILSFLISVIGFFFSSEILAFMGADAETIDKGSGFMLIMLVGNLPILFLFMLNGIFRGVGNPAIAMYSLLIGNAANIILDPILIFGHFGMPEMGVNGAALASVIGRGIGVLFQIYFLQRKSSKIRITKKHLRIDIDIIVSLLKVAVGGIFQYFISSISWVILTRITAQLGQNAVASYTIVMRVIMMTLLPSWGVANAAATLVGQNLGAKKPERASKSVWRAAHVNGIYLLIVGLFYYIFAMDLVSSFSIDLEVVKYAGIGLQIIAFGYVFYGYGMIMSQAFNGAGNTLVPMVLNIISFIVVQAPLAYILAVSYDYNQSGIYISIAISYSLMAILAMIIFSKGSWKKVKV